MTFLLIAASLVAYVIIGCIIARTLRSQIIKFHTVRVGDRYRDPWGDWKTHREAKIDRDAIVGSSWQMILGWPVCSWVLMINNDLEAALDRVDPEVQQRKIREQEQRIGELERELRIGK